MAFDQAAPSVGHMPTAIVTGASRGLGRALATGFADAGWAVIGAGRTAETIDGITTVRGDIRDPAHRAALLSAAKRLDLLVNNAGILGPSPQPSLADYPLSTLRDVFEVNVFAPLALTQL